MRQFNVGDKLTAEEVLVFLKTTGGDGVYSDEDIREMLEDSEEYEVVEISLNQLEEPFSVSAADKDADTTPMVVGHHPDGSYKTIEGGYQQWKAQTNGSKRVKAIVPA